MPLLYSIGKVTVGKAMILGWRPHVEGLEHIPATGGAVFAGNHLSVADELFLGSVVPRHIAFWAKAEYFSGKGLGGFFTKGLMHGLGAIKVERAGGRAALTAFDGAIPVLKAGDMVAIYPEGTVTRDQFRQDRRMDRREFRQERRQDRRSLRRENRRDRRD